VYSRAIRAIGASLTSKCPRTPGLLAAGTLALAALATGAGAVSAASGSTRASPTPATVGSSADGTQGVAPAASAPFRVGLRVLRLQDNSRVIRPAHGGLRARTLVTYVRYPALAAGAGDRPDAPAARVAGPFPLIVFGHGFALTPAPYAALLRSWTSAGYVVAAPVFPLENANAPGGPDESDLINQPQDMRFVVSSLLAASRAASGPLAGLIDPRRIAVAGHSDGAETALAVAYSRRFRDARVGAAVILSGAEMSGVGGFGFAHGSPPLLATQGTADTINEPRFTSAFFGLARPPKFLLRLLGAGHLPPYTSEQPELRIVERVSIAFLDGYLKRDSAALGRLGALANVPGKARLLADP
jgi:hypothetical protein